VIRWTRDGGSGRLFGVQVLGRLGSEIAKRVDVAAAAIHSGLRSTRSATSAWHTPRPWAVLGRTADRRSGLGGEPMNLGRRLFAEALGTGLLVTAVIGSGIAAATLSPGDVGLQLLENASPPRRVSQ
jgi:hypothetical protein